MVIKSSDSPLTEADELLHKPTSQLKWRESYYFNWVDFTNNISGFSTIGIVPNENRQEFVFLLFLKENNEVYYKESLLRNYQENISRMLTDKKLKYKLIKPFKIWQIEYRSRKLTCYLRFEARFPTYVFGIDSSASWHQHFEASGIVKGSIKLRSNKIIKFSGYGQRDKSWGYRDWHQFDKWYASHFQFRNWSCTFRKDYCNNQINLSGQISSKKVNMPLSNLEIETIDDNDKFQSPLSASYLIKDIQGNEYRINAERINKSSFIRFVRQFQGGYTELFEQMVLMKNLDTDEIGSGMMEHLRTFRTSNF
jgi:hypothetical protein